VYGSFHGCVNFLLVAREIFMSFSGYFRWIFVRSLFLRFRGVRVQICLWRSWIYVSYIFVLDLDSSNSEFGLRLKEFFWKPSSLCELGRTLIPDDLVVLRLQFLGHRIPWGHFTSPPNHVSRAQVVWEIHGWIGGVDFSFLCSGCCSRVYSHPADSPPGRRRQSAWTSVRPSVSLVRVRSWFDPLSQVFLVA
jgi:hypothetical protein